MNMVCPSENHVLEKNKKKRQKYLQFAFEGRERRPGYSEKVVSIVIGRMAERVKVTREQIRKILIYSMQRNVKNGVYGIGEYTEKNHHHHRDWKLSDVKWLLTIIGVSYTMGQSGLGMP